MNIEDISAQTGVSVPNLVAGIAALGMAIQSGITPQQLIAGASVGVRSAKLDEFRAVREQAETYHNNITAQEEEIVSPIMAKRQARMNIISNYQDQEAQMRSLSEGEVVIPSWESVKSQLDNA